METISDLGYVLAMWSVTGAACLGWGALYQRATRGDRVVDPEWAGLFWSGFAVLIGLLQMWHLFLAVDWVASGVLLGAGVCAGYLPTDDQEVRLWDAPLPSAPTAKPGLELRGSGLADGFRTRVDAAANP